MKRRKATAPAAAASDAPELRKPRFRLSPSGWAVLVLALIFAGLPFAMGKYIEFNSPGPFDSGAYVYSAQHILNGAEIGTEERPSARLGTLLVNILGVALFGFSDTGPKVIQMFLQLGALVLMFLALRRAFGRLAALFGVVIAATYLSCPLIAKYGNVKEQYMTAFLVMGVSCFILYHLGGKLRWAVLAGAFASWGPLFKETGISAPFALGVFILLLPLIKIRTWKQTSRDIAFLALGAAAALAPIFIWILAFGVNLELPYASYFKTLFAASSAQQNQPLLAAAMPLLPQFTLASYYVTKSREIFGFAKQAPMVLRFYADLLTPVFFSLLSLLAAGVRALLRLRKKAAPAPDSVDRFVVLLGIWWLLDMAFIWISPRSYEQYYIPMTASGAMLGAYVIHLYARALSRSVNKMPWLLAGLVGLFVLVPMTLPPYIGIARSPFWGTPYKDSAGRLERQKGFFDRIAEINRAKKVPGAYPWQAVGNYIRENTTPDDRIYVWGWIPGIYVQAQRFSPAAKAFEGNMHIYPPETLSREVRGLVSAFEKTPPKFIVDTRKRHFPWNVPPLELWPQVPNPQDRSRQLFLPNDPRIIEQYEQQFTRLVSEKIGPEEAARFEAVKPLRDFVMSRYEPVRDRSFGPEYVVFKRKSDAL